jgi:hypothetical protein
VGGFAYDSISSISDLSKNCAKSSSSSGVGVEPDFSPTLNAGRHEPTNLMPSSSSSSCWRSSEQKS